MAGRTRREGEKEMTTDEGAESGALEELEAGSTHRTYGTRFIDRLKSLGSAPAWNKAYFQLEM